MPSQIAKTIIIAIAGASFLATVATAEPAPSPVQRSRVQVATTPGMPEFRDPKTGQIWTPENVGRGPMGKPTPADLAFDPLAQAERIKGVVVQRAGFTPLGWDAPSAGPGTPLVMMDNASLRAVPGKRWQVVLYVSNNSAGTLAPMIDCRFTNAGKLVEETRVLLPGIGAGVRGGLTIHGPRTDLFVDRADCRIVSP